MERSAREAFKDVGRRNGSLQGAPVNVSALAIPAPVEPFWRWSLSAPELQTTGPEGRLWIIITQVRRNRPGALQE